MMMKISQTAPAMQRRCCWWWWRRRCRKEKENVFLLLTLWLLNEDLFVKAGKQERTRLSDIAKSEKRHERVTNKGETWHYALLFLRRAPSTIYRVQRIFNLISFYCHLLFRKSGTVAHVEATFTCSVDTHALHAENKCVYVLCARHQSGTKLLIDLIPSIVCFYAHSIVR